MTKFISLKTSLPGPKSQEIAKRKEKYIAKPMGSSLGFELIGEVTEGFVFKNVLRIMDQSNKDTA